jgi:hypothetical protein
MRSMLCVLCVVVQFPVVEGPCKRYAMARHVCQPTTASRGRRWHMVCSTEGYRMNITRGSTGRWQCRNLHNPNRPHASPHASTTTPVRRLRIPPAVGETLTIQPCYAWELFLWARNMRCRGHFTAAIARESNTTTVHVARRPKEVTARRRGHYGVGLGVPRD